MCRKIPNNADKNRPNMVPTHYGMDLLAMKLTTNNILHVVTNNHHKCTKLIFFWVDPIYTKKNHFLVTRNQHECVEGN